MILFLQQGLLADGFAVPITKLCAWFGVPRRTVYYKPVKAPPKIDPAFEKPIKAMIEENPSFGYRTIAWLLGFNKNTVQRIFRLKGWQVRKRPVGARPRIEALPSVAEAPNERSLSALCCANACRAMGLPIWPASGPVRTAGRHWPWSWTATRASCSAGISRAPGRHPPRPRRWSMR